jgi:hypothetical protein
MACVLGFRRVIHLYFLQHGVTIIAKYYNNKVIWKKRSGKLSKIIILLHNTTHPLMSNLMKVTMAAVGCKIINHPSYSTDSAPGFSIVWTNEGAPGMAEI